MLAEKTNFTITRMVRLLEISRWGYYAWIGGAPSPASIRRVHIEQKVSCFHGDSDEVYGAPGILADLRADGEIISRKTVAATMRRLGLAGICPKKWKTTTIIDAHSRRVIGWAIADHMHTDLIQDASRWPWFRAGTARRR
ncbi:hypothetical protein E3T34_14775 [Cryobacterium sp. TMT1-62]|uniref:IS3 family transposase n=1 Tax=unclassified Cryobacterium TaxID=2649013 RepID=UPI000CE34958|nr:MULTISPECIES: IS3 family transposase [unclassified Cryobacterium]TFD29894.1 hypothetical protein E3T34_14775 [Cryobacterium sp. TMT1-62]